MSLHWAASHLFDQARRSMKLDIPLLYMYGELDDANRLMNCGADLYSPFRLRPTDPWRNSGPPGKAASNPFLIHPQFEHGNLSKEEARRRLGLPADRFTVVLSLGGEGIGLSLGFLNRFVKDINDVTMVVLTGHNNALLSK